MASGSLDDDAAAEVAAMQFAAGMSVALIAQEWDQSVAWVESAIRVALLKYIPRRDGGLKLTRTKARAASSEELAAVRESQGALFSSTCDSERQSGT